LDFRDGQFRALQKQQQPQPRRVGKKAQRFYD
jgi:hypothetical protein